MSVLASAYGLLPPPLQSAAVSIVGWRSRRRKYGSLFRAALDELEHNESQPPGVVGETSRRSLERTLRFAAEQVPHYRGCLPDPERLAEWPLISKADVLRDPNALRPTRPTGRVVTILKTSGTTGRPLAVPCDTRGYQREMAFRWRHRAWAGIGVDARGAYLAGHAVVPASQQHPPYWRHDWAENRVLFSSYHLGPKTIRDYVRGLDASCADFLHGYPSSLALLAAGMIAAGLRVELRAVFCASETLQPHQRRLIEQAFATRAYNWYGQTELTCNIVECRLGGLHIRSDYGFVEVLDSGELVATGFNNLAMPLVRYRTGDRVVPGGSCACGMPFPVVREVLGRMEDYVVTPEGYLVGRLDHLFKGAHGVVEAQLFQPDRAHLEIRIVRGPEWTGRDESFVEAQARERLGRRIVITFAYPTILARTENGKAPFVVSHVDRKSDVLDLLEHVDRDATSAGFGF